MFVQFNKELYWVIEIFDILAPYAKQAVTKKRKTVGDASDSTSSNEKVYIALNCGDLDNKVALKTSDCTDVDVFLDGFYEHFAYALEKDLSESNQELEWKFTYNGKQYTIDFINNVSKDGFEAVLDDDSEKFFRYEFITNSKLQ